MNALDDLMKKQRVTHLEACIGHAAVDEGWRYSAEQGAAELTKLESDYTATIKANAELARLNADLQERVEAQTAALAVAKEFVVSWNKAAPGDLLDGLDTIDKLEALTTALAALDGIK